MTEVTIATKFQNQNLDWLQTEGIGLATLDLDKVMCDFNAIDIYPGALAQVDRIRDRGTNVALVTNCDNQDRLHSIGQALHMPIFYKGLDGMKGKPAPDMLIAAAESVPLGSAGSRTAHFDDQLKAWRSSIGASFDWFVWTRPDGKLLTDHPGVLLFRTIEVSFGITAIAGLNIARTARDMKRGDW